ncbi:hypothetical protein [Parasediminibacterium sp. JCM 36343]|uniref:hypothetical protein n=1 Tax=Parasediminibacterium sp. JCM 36343 TaxID=3374279 RepID=UPI00397D0953
MQKDSFFWVCMVLNMVLLLLFVMLKPAIHLLPGFAMYILIKLELIVQIALGFYGLSVSINRSLFAFFTKLYVILLLVYILLKIPALAYLNDYYIVVPSMFTPLPFVVAWLLNKAFYEKQNEV